jgi:chromosome segregation ATPase
MSELSLTKIRFGRKLKRHRCVRKEGETLFKAIQQCIWLIAILLLLGSCNKLASEQEVLSAFKKIAVYESDLVEQQEKLNELEQKQNELYDLIMSYGMKQFAKVMQLSKESLKIIEEREKHIEKENRAVQSAKQQIITVKEEIHQLHDENIRRQVNRLVNIAEKCYETYDNLYFHYKEMLSSEKELYILLQNKYVASEQIQQQINRINKQYKEIVSINARFNEYTEKYNKEKKRLYDIWK